MFPRISAVTPKENFRLQLVFTNGEKKEFSVEPYLDYTVFKPLRERAFFETVSTQNGTICWGENADIDFDPDTLYLESVVLGETSID